MMIMDVEFTVKNEHDILLSLAAVRTAQDDHSISRLEKTYDNTVTNIGASDDDWDYLRASDFYNFSATFTATPYASGTALYNALHIKQKLSTDTGETEENEKEYTTFSNETGTYYSNMSIPISLKETGDSLSIPASSDEKTYHCYITVDYDAYYMRYFFYQARFGLTYYLERDYGFYFTGTQVTSGGETA